MNSATLTHRAEWAEGTADYDIKGCREGMAAVLLNLALDDQLVETIATKSSLLSAIETTLLDALNLSPRCKKKLDDVAFQIKVHSDAGKQEAHARKVAAHASQAEPHVMLSYCWAQQDVVKLIRADLGTVRVFDRIYTRGCRWSHACSLHSSRVSTTSYRFTLYIPSKH
jgi:hypothetical protein